jgi:hypothetical protein
MVRYQAVLCSLVLLLCSRGVAAQSATDADMKEIQAYKLSLPVFKQIVTATRSMMEAVKKDPRYGQMLKLKAELKALEAKEEPSDADMARREQLEAQIDELENSVPKLSNQNASLSEMAASMQKEPIVANALKSAGLGAREFATFMLAFFQASMIHGMQKGGMVKEIPKELANTVNLENIKFVSEHEAEISTLMKEMEALTKEPGQ